MGLMRARAVVAGGMFASSVSLPVQAIRLTQESQHWIALLSWTICTFILICLPVVMRLTTWPGLGSGLVSVALLIGSLGVAIAEGGVTSPNSMVMLIAPAVATMLGGRMSGFVVGVLVLGCCAGMWLLHTFGMVPSESPLQAGALVTMRIMIIAALAGTLAAVQLFYEAERDRTEAELAQAAVELADAHDAVVEGAAAKLALLASQHRELERDLELTAAVQKLLLPKRDSMQTEHISLAGFSIPARNAGGDWWFSEVLQDGTLRVLLGDVTGHGTAPAMVAAVVAGAFRALQGVVQYESRTVLGVLNQILLDVSAGMYTMPFGILELSPNGRGTWLSAAASPVLILRRDGEIDTVSTPGTPLGSDVLQLGQGSFHLEAGERVLLSSDGVPELRMSTGHEFGLRRLSKLLKATHETAVERARDDIVEHLDRMRGDDELHDDVTFALIELRASRVQLAHG